MRSNPRNRYDEKHSPWIKLRITKDQLPFFDMLSGVLHGQDVHFTRIGKWKKRLEERGALELFFHYNAHVVEQSEPEKRDITSWNPTDAVEVALVMTNNYEDMTPHTLTAHVLLARLGLLKRETPMYEQLIDGNKPIYAVDGSVQVGCCAIPFIQLEAIYERARRHM